MKAKFIKISPELLAQMFQLPEGASVVAVYKDDAHFWVRVDHPDFPDTADATLAPLLVGHCERDANGVVTITYPEFTK